jgi:hypothetical protein
MPTTGRILGWHTESALTVQRAGVSGLRMSIATCIVDGLPNDEARYNDFSYRDFPEVGKASSPLLIPMKSSIGLHARSSIGHKSRMRRSRRRHFRFPEGLPDQLSARSSALP